MTLMTDAQIFNRCDNPLNTGMITPYIPEKVSTHYNERLNEHQRVISYGQSHAGYDMRLGNEFIFNNPYVDSIDPKNIQERQFIRQYYFEPFVLPGHETVLGVSMEYFKIPHDVMSIVFGKSTYARCGLIVNVTPMEPGWEGYLTIEIQNVTSKGIRIYPEEGIAQAVFFELGNNVMVPYGNGKYQKQQGVTHAKV